MVKEVYCSYELSKLLKEKGFEISTPNSIPCVYYDYKKKNLWIYPPKCNEMVKRRKENHY